jgi:hypothetical protein
VDGFHAPSPSAASDGRPRDGDRSPAGFLTLPMQAAHIGRAFIQTWAPGGPWQSRSTSGLATRSRRPPPKIVFPPLLDTPAPLLRAYSHETVVAEKLHAIVTLGQANSRMKDYYDFLALARLFAFEGPFLTEAIRATFDRRATQVLSEMSVGLSQTFADNQQKVTQWTAFTRREPLLLPTGALAAVIVQLRDFLALPMEAAHG